MSKYFNISSCRFCPKCLYTVSVKNGNKHSCSINKKDVTKNVKKDNISEECPLGGLIIGYLK